MLAQALDKDPAKRPDSATAIIEAAQRALGDETINNLGPPVRPGREPESDATTVSSPGVASR